MITTREVQTSQGLHRQTDRVWIAPNGHKVDVFTDQNITGRSTWAERNNAFAVAHFNCECGRSMMVHGQPRKAQMNGHDQWTTEAERVNIRKNIDAMMAKEDN